MSIYNKVSELEWYLCQKALLKEFLSKNAYEKYLSNLDRFHAEWEGLHEPKIVETENKSALAVYSPINAMLVLSPGAELNLPLGYVLPKDFLWMQIYPDTLLFSEGKTSGAVKVNGSILKLTNISDESIQRPLCKEAAIGLGMTKEQRDKLNSLTSDPDCPFVLFIGHKKLIKRKPFEDFINNEFTQSL